MNKKIILIFVFVLILIKITFGLSGSSSTNEIRLNINYFNLEQNTSSNFLRAFSKYLSFNQTTTNFNPRFGILNLRPSIPILNQPLNGSFHKATPELNWSNSTDPELFSTITYIVEVSDTSAFTYTNYSNDTVRETANVTQDINLTISEGEWYWRVRAYDQYDNSTAFSEIRNFTIDLTSPGSFNLTSPTNNTNSTDNTPALAWQENTEIYFDEYLIEFSNELDFSIINFSFSNVDTIANNSFSNWNSTEILGNGTWYWRVTAYDKVRHSTTADAFVYNVENPVETLTQETIRTAFQGGGARGGAKRIQQVALDIIQPGPLSLFSNDTITTPLFLINKGDSALRNINLEALTNATNLNLELTQKTISILLPGQIIAIDLIIRSTDQTTGQEQHEITVEANVLDPSFKDSAKFFINLLEFGFGERKEALDKIEVLRNIIEGNPECLELKELLDQAITAVNNRQYNKAISLIDAAIKACKDIVASLGKELVVKPRVTREYYIAIIEALAALILFSLIYRYYKKKRGKQKL